MAATYKYYGTNIYVYGDMLNKLISLGYKGTHNQFRIVCKAKSKAEANRIAESFGLSKETFKRGYTSETENKLQLEMADKYNLIICKDGTHGEDYIGIKDIIPTNSYTNI